ncbi:hypothetical protein BDK51DRAFT_41267, partial [Blyttiomyces helicus]
MDKEFALAKPPGGTESPKVGLREAGSRAAIESDRRPHFPTPQCRLQLFLTESRPRFPARRPLCPLKLREPQTHPRPSLYLSAPPSSPSAPSLLPSEACSGYARTGRPDLPGAPAPARSDFSHPWARPAPSPWSSTSGQTLGSSPQGRLPPAPLSSSTFRHASSSSSSLPPSKRVKVEDKVEDAFDVDEWEAPSSSRTWPLFGSPSGAKSTARSSPSATVVIDLTGDEALARKLQAEEDLDAMQESRVYSSSPIVIDLTDDEKIARELQQKYDAESRNEEQDLLRKRKSQEEEDERIARELFAQEGIVLPGASGAGSSSAPSSSSSPTIIDTSSPAPPLHRSPAPSSDVYPTFSRPVIHRPGPNSVKAAFFLPAHAHGKVVKNEAGSSSKYPQFNRETARWDPHVKMEAWAGSSNYPPLRIPPRIPQDPYVKNERGVDPFRQNAGSSSNTYVPGLTQS